MSNPPRGPPPRGPLPAFGLNIPIGPPRGQPPRGQPQIGEQPHIQPPMNIALQMPRGMPRPMPRPIIPINGPLMLQVQPVNPNPNVNIIPLNPGFFPVANPPRAVNQNGAYIIRQDE